MNGVRRFFAANNAASSSPSPTPSTSTETVADQASSPTKPPPLQTVLPLTVASGKQLYPPTSDTRSPVQPTSPPTSPGTATVGLFLRKDGPGSPRRKPVNSPENKTLPLKPPSNPAPAPSARKPVRSPTPPIASASSATLTNGSPRRPAPPRVVQLSKQSISALDNEWRGNSTLVNTRDDLLMSLLASEAVVDSRGFEILSAEEVEELKREQQLLSSRLVAMRKKAALETKIRDAALNLQKVQTVKRLSKQTSEQVDAGNRKVDIATKELSRLLERASDVDRKLLEHRAGVLSLSVRNLEAKYCPPNIHGDATEDTTSTSGSAILSQDPNSPTSSVTSMSTRTKFDGAHLFAGHADSIVPGMSRKATSAQMTVLMEKLNATEEAVEKAQARESDLQKQVKLLRLEKSDVEATLNLELQTAEGTISKLERDLAHLERTARDKEEWDHERQALEDELDQRKRMMTELRRRVEELEAAGTRRGGIQEALLSKDEEIRLLQEDGVRQLAAWSSERERLERSKLEEVERVRGEVTGLKVATEQLDAGRNALRSVVRSHKVPTSPDDTSFPSLASSLSTHMAGLKSKLEQSEREKVELEGLRRKYEEDVRNGFDIRERLGREVEEARREREEARKEVRLLEARIKEQSDRVVELANVRSSAPPTVVEPKPSEEYAKIISMLRGLWSTLPSVEARASKMGKNNSLAPNSPGGSLSLSDMDVRSLKTLYDPKTGFSSPTVVGEFSVETFVARIQALLVDDRALIERLIRFAQSHDLLRNNAERAQKLAQDSNKGLEMYQTQVKALEERNIALSRKQLSLLDEINSLQQSVDQALEEKRHLESQAEEQSETVRNLTSANNTLSARALAFAEEAAAAPNALKAKLESQLGDIRTKLQESQDEIERMRSSESIQRVALLDELNSLQQENGKLRDQLRAKK